MALLLLSYLSEGLRRQTLSSQRSRLAFLRGNLQLLTMIGQGVPEVRSHHQQVQIVVCPSMMHDGTSLRTTSRDASHRTTFVTSLKIEGVLGSEHHPHHIGL
jgi:hypothetical protein